MPDQFTNARAYFNPTFPSSGDPFSVHGFRNVFAGLGFLDMLPLQPRAHSPADLKIMVRGQDASSFFNPVYYGNADQRVTFSSGDTPTIAAPVSNPRIDIIYVTPSGSILVKTGTEAAAPTLPSLSPSGDTRFPIAAVWCKVGMTKIVNFEDRNANSGDGYIYKDLRPWMRTAGAGSGSVSTASPTTPTGDAQATGGVSTAAAAVDHRHAGVHGVRLVGSSLIQGDVEISGPGGMLSQSGNRLIISSGGVVQTAYQQVTGVVTLNTTTNFNDTAMASTDGTQIDTLVYTPRNKANRLRIEFYGFIGGVSTGVHCVAGLFKDAEPAARVTAIAAGVLAGGGADAAAIYLCYEFIANTTSAITFAVRGGPSSAASVYLNGDGTGTRLFGGTAGSHWKITEFAQ